MDALSATVTEIRDWLVERVAAYTEMPTDDVDPTADLVDLGMDSLNRVEIGLEIEEIFKFELEPEFFRRCVTIDDVAEALHAQVHADPAAPGEPE
jgi:acyl carrier protein